MKKILTSLSLITTAGLLSACASHTTMNSVHYHCEQDLEPLEIRFYPDQDKAELVLNGEVMELPQQRAASGFWYSNDRYTVRGKGKELWLEIGRRAPIECTAV